MNPVRIRLDESVKNIVKILYLQFANIQCQEHIPEMWKEIDILSNQYRRQFNNPSDALEHLRPARDLYRAFGVEPTQNRPSSEALLRRVVKNKPLYQINSIVDCSNYFSLYFFLPIGLYDLNNIEGNITLRLGKVGEEYRGIRKDMIHVQNRLTLADDVGPFGNPSADSLRTSITKNTREILVAIFAPAIYDIERLEHYREFTEKIYLKYHNKGKLVSAGIVS